MGLHANSEAEQNATIAHLKTCLGHIASEVLVKCMEPRCLYRCTVLVHDVAFLLDEETVILEIAAHEGFFESILENAQTQHPEFPDYAEKAFGILLRLSDKQAFPRLAPLVTQTLLESGG